MCVLRYPYPLRVLITPHLVCLLSHCHVSCAHEELWVCLRACTCHSCCFVRVLINCVVCAGACAHERACVCGCACVCVCVPTGPFVFCLRCKCSVEIITIQRHYGLYSIITSFHPPPCPLAHTRYDVPPSSFSLLGEIPAILGDLKHLLIMSAGSNRLQGKIPPALGGLSNLLRLELQDNMLTGHLPEELATLTNLHNLLLHKVHSRVRS